MSAKKINFAPQKQGMYNPAYDKDSCGFAFVASLKGKSNDVLQKVLNSLCALEHRGAVGADQTGDGSGVLFQMPFDFLRKNVDFNLPSDGFFASGLMFVDNLLDINEIKNGLQKIADKFNINILGYRDIQTNNENIGLTAKKTQPIIKQIFITCGDYKWLELDKNIYAFRRTAEKDLGVYFPSLSSRTITYKGMLTTFQLQDFYLDLQNKDLKTAFAIVHSRYSTNTFPAWNLAQPLRNLAHNGEINTISANRNWFEARSLKAAFLKDCSRPILTPGASDSASFDEAIELLILNGVPIEEAMLRFVPPAFEKNSNLSPELSAFYKYNATLMHPWDGPAAIAFTDGSKIGATLDRNGLRPARYSVLKSGLIILGSEAGMIDIEENDIDYSSRLIPGQMLLIDTEKQIIIGDTEIKDKVSKKHDYQSLYNSVAKPLREVADIKEDNIAIDNLDYAKKIFGISLEDETMHILPMSENKIEMLYAMGDDTPIAALAGGNLFNYFYQNFAQVTNPPLDSIREEIVTNLSVLIGPEGDVINNVSHETFRQIALEYPLLLNEELEAIGALSRTKYINICFDINKGVAGLEEALEKVANEAVEAVKTGAQILILSDKNFGDNYMPIHPLLAVSYTHNALIKNNLRDKTALIIQSGYIFETHHAACVFAFGATAANPYLALKIAADKALDKPKAQKNLIYALSKGVQKIMSKMGISVFSSYIGSLSFEAVGLNEEFIDKYFSGCTSSLSGAGLQEIFDYIKRNYLKTDISLGGVFHQRRGEEQHILGPKTMFYLRQAAKLNRYDLFEKYCQDVDNSSMGYKTIRSLLDFKETRAIDINEVESEESIIKRFSTGAMSYGSISLKAHETLAKAMNILGARSNTGEGGEMTERLLDPSRNSAIKQVASGRFGVTSIYLTNATDIQIKLAQGAKPGEGGQLPPNKMYPWIARARGSTPAVGLISPPPHHDIYSIEDLKQLIYDLKRSNPAARIHVKLVASSSVGAVAAGAAKAGADVILISGYDGGTGAAHLNSIRHTGLQWEIGLTKAQHTLIANGLRDRVVLQTDGKLLTPKDVLIAAALGAEEFSFASAPLIVMGCIMMRVCNKDTCPVGIATQNPVLTDRFEGKVEEVINFFKFMARGIRLLLSQLGARSLDEIIGRSDLLRQTAGRLDLKDILYSFENTQLKNQISQNHEIEKHFDNKVIDFIKSQNGLKCEYSYKISTLNRSVGTLLGSYITKKYQDKIPETLNIQLKLEGSAGQSLAAFMPKGIDIYLTGAANDYVGKGLSGGNVYITPFKPLLKNAEKHILAGNVIGYGATSGKIYIAGRVGERFCVRNSGALAICLGAGDHALEYMTGGSVIILGKVGRNFAAGFSGGFAYIYDFDKNSLNSEIEKDLLIKSASSTEDITFLQTSLKDFEKKTGYPTGGFEIGRFIKLVPKTYLEVLKIQKESPDATDIELWQELQKRVFSKSGTQSQKRLAADKALKH